MGCNAWVRLFAYPHSCFGPVASWHPVWTIRFKIEIGGISGIWWTAEHLLRRLPFIAS